MQKSSFNFATVFSLMVLLVFTYITYLGLVYWQQGDMALPIMLSVGLIALVVVCVFIMCKSKATRWRRIGKTGQVVFGLIVLVAFIMASLPFTNFLRVMGDSSRINEMVNTTCDKAIGIDEAYNTYVNERIDNYRRSLQLIASGKTNRPSVYQEAMGKAPGATDDKKIENLTNSLRSRLLPDSATSVINERHKWLERAKNESVMNPLTPANINKVSSCVDDWSDNYKDLSKISYMGEENVEEFTADDFDKSLSQLTATYATLQAPSVVAIIIALVCFAIMLLPYWITEGDLAAASSNKPARQWGGMRPKAQKQSGNLFNKNGF